MEFKDPKKITDMLLAAIDLKKIMAYMCLTNWTWCGIGVPTEKDIREEIEQNVRYLHKTIKRTINDPSRDDPWSTYTGGFELSALLGEDQQLYYRLRFIFATSGYKQSPKNEGNK